MVVGVRAPRQPEVVAELGHPHRPRHGPEVRVGERDVHGVRADGVGQLPPVRGDHVGRRRQPGGPLELGHGLPPREAALRPARVFGIGQDAAEPPAEPDGVGQQPAAVGVEGDPGVGEAAGQRGDRLDLLLAGQHAALELEVGEAVTLLGGLGQRDHRVGGERLAAAQLGPAVAGAVVHEVGQVGLSRVADVEQVAQHRHPVAPAALAEQVGHGQAEELAVQVEQAGLQAGDGVDGGAQVEGLLPAPARVAAGEPLGDRAQQRAVSGHRPAGQQPGRLLDGLADGLAAGHLTQPGAAVGVGDDDDVAGEERPVRAAEVEQHAVVPGDRHDLDAADGG